MGEADDKMLKAIKHYQESLERHTKTGKSEKLLHAIGKLALLPIRVWHLEETGVGRTVNGLKKIEGAVGEHARNLVDKWKFMVKGEEEKQESLENEHNSIKQEKVDAVVLEPVQELVQVSTNQANGDNDKRSFKTNASAHSRSPIRSPISNNQSSRDCNQSKTNSSHSTKRHNSKKTNDKNSPSDSEVASKRHKLTKSASKSKNSNYSDTNSESESDNESDSSKQSESESRSVHSTSGSSGNSSSGSSESSSSDDEDCDKTESRRKRHSSNESCSDDYRHKKSINLSNSKKRSREDSVNDSKTKEYSKTYDSKKKYKNNQSDSSDEGDNDLKYKAKKHKDTKISSSKNDDKHNRHHDSKSVSNKSRHSTEKSIESKLNSKSDSSKYKNSKLTDSESASQGQEKSKDRDSHRSSNKSSKSDDSRKGDSREEKSHKEKKDDKNETIRKRTRDASASRESKKCKTDTESKDSRRSHHHSSPSKSQEKAREKTSDMSKVEKSTHRSKAKNETRDPSRDKSSDSKANKVPKKLLDGIDSGSGTSFADVLGMLEAPVYSKSKKKSTTIDEPIVYSPKKTSSASKEDKCVKGTKQTGDSSSFKTNEEVPSLLQDPVGLDPLDINISSLLPSITPNYRPLGVTLDANKKMYMDEEAFSKVIAAKHQRTKVYSGNKVSYTKVPTLFDLCSRILQDNLDALEYTGGVPYSILKPILEKANPNQLYQLEFHNPYLIEDTDELWQLHCQKEFRNKKREELESWREMYLRCLDEREAKLKALTANIKQSQDKSLPVRQTKLAYVDSVVKPPRNIARKQMKNGTAIEIKKPSQTPTERLNQLARSGEAAKIAVPNPSRSTVERSSSHSSHIKPKKAPLMAKTLSLLKNRFGRR